MGPASTSSAGSGALQIWLIPVLRDNYVIVLQRDDRVVVVDPAVSEPVVIALRQRGLTLEAILQTHHHSDHIGGTAGLLQEWPAAVVIAAAADRERIPLQTRGVTDGDQLELLDQPLQVLAVPGHTRAHIAFWLPESGDLFCGDALFAAGCGRMFEGTPEQMHSSLQRLAALPEATRVWCAHEYTEGNLRWACHEAPGNAAIAERLEQVQRLRAAGQATLPSTIGLEQRTNLFLQATSPAELARLRRSKDSW